MRCGFLAAALAALWAHAARAAPLELYGKLPTIETLALSPDGENIALIATSGEVRRIIVTRLADRKPLLVAEVGQAKLRALQWAGNEHVIITNSVTAIPRDVLTKRAEWAMAFDLDLRKRKLRPLLKDAKDSMNTIQDTPEVRMIGGEPVVFLQGIHFVDGMGVLSLFKVDMDNASSKLVETGVRDTRDWLVGMDGQPIAQVRYTDKGGIWSLLLKPSSGGWREIQRLAAPTERPGLRGLGRDGKSVLVEVESSTGSGW